MVALTRAIGRKRAMEMLLTGEPIDARTAADWGLVNRVVPADRAGPRRRASSRARIAAVGRARRRVGKEAFYAQIDLDQPKAYAYAKEVMAMNALADDAQEGMARVRRQARAGVAEPSRAPSRRIFYARTRLA